MRILCQDVQYPDQDSNRTLSEYVSRNVAVEIDWIVKYGGIQLEVAPNYYKLYKNFALKTKLGKTEWVPAYLFRAIYSSL
jgi:hypothetical protein